MRSLAALVVLAAGCTGGMGAAPPPSCTAAVPLHVVQAQVFDRCGGGPYGAGCHASAPFGANMDLTDGHAWASLVDFPAQSSQTKFRVEPGDVASSFLWQKLADQIASDGTEGLPMPRDTSDHWAELSTADLTDVACWIDGGAKND